MKRVAFFLFYFLIPSQAHINAIAECCTVSVAFAARIARLRRIQRAMYITACAGFGVCVGTGIRLLLAPAIDRVHLAAAVAAIVLAGFSVVSLFVAENRFWRAGL